MDNLYLCSDKHFISHNSHFNFKDRNEINDMDEDQFGEMEMTENAYSDNRNFSYDNNQIYLLNDDNQKIGEDEASNENKSEFFAPSINELSSKNVENPPKTSSWANKYIETEFEDKSNLMKLEYISVCQLCKEIFNSPGHIPYLLKCGHFFCDQCINNELSDKDGMIHCPDDGVVAGNITELKVLNNLIVDNKKSPRNLCEKHPDQKLNFYVETIKEVICADCAFSRFKDNQDQLKELPQKCDEISKELSIVVSENQKNIKLLQNCLESIKENKNIEEFNISAYYGKLIKLLEDQREKHIDHINSIFNTNADRLSEKLDEFSKTMEEAEEYIRIIHNVSLYPISGIQAEETIKHFSQFIQHNSEGHDENMTLVEFKFINENQSKIISQLSILTQLKQSTKEIQFGADILAKKFSSLLDQKQLNFQAPKPNISIVPKSKINCDFLESNPKSFLPSSVLGKPEFKGSSEAKSNIESKSSTSILKRNEVADNTLVGLANANCNAAKNNILEYGTKYLKPVYSNQFGDFKSSSVALENKTYSYFARSCTEKFRFNAPWSMQDDEYLIHHEHLKHEELPYSVLSSPYVNDYILIHNTNNLGILRSTAKASCGNKDGTIEPSNNNSFNLNKYKGKSAINDDKSLFTSINSTNTYKKDDNCVNSTPLKANYCNEHINKPPQKAANSNSNHRKYLIPKIN